MAANGIEDPTTLKVGQELLIPGSGVLKPVVEADSPEPKAPDRAPPPPEKKKGLLKVGKADGTLGWPLRGVLYARFGRKGSEAHDGIDLAAPAGTPVKTAGEGEVLFAGDQKGYGLIAIVEHPNRLVTLYAHNRDLRVKTGQKVREGQVIATVGDSGATSGPHLHFEVRKDGKPVDPLEHLGPVPSAP
jgi:murein DD-endopeptidase MepM/ murein hydrolase activator NlpD